MPALALRLDCGVMTLYGYLDSKADLLAAIAERGMRDLRLARPLPADAGGVLAAWGRALRATLVEHPALSAIFIERPVIGPGILAGVEALLGALIRVGYRPDLGVRAVYTVLIYTIGFVAWEIPRVRTDGQPDYGRAWRTVAASVGIERLPIVSTVIDQLATVAGPDQFELGLVALTAGLAAMGARAVGPGAPQPA